MSDTRIQHTTYQSLYKDSNADPMGMNNKAVKMEKIATYSYPWRTKDGAPSVADLKQIVCENFADYNTGGIGVWVVGPDEMQQLKVFVGLKKYTSDSSSVFLTLFGHHYGFVGDVKDGTGEINKFD